MLPQEIIARKRDRERLSEEEISSFISGVTEEKVSEGQIAAFAMAVYLNGMEPEETVALTLAMRDSGAVLDWSGLGGGAVDKHSTGGVGDNVSLMLAPLVAACGGYVPMISGRGLGHTGGTLDKFESIPGYSTAPDNRLFRDTVDRIGCAVIGQTSNLAPADRRIYAVRDVTATVESVPLITASILSKKLAAGLNGLVLDVKVGSGSFMGSLERARALAHSLTDTAQGAGLRASALLTDMDHPLATAAGNAVEMRNAIDFLANRQADSRLREVTMALCAEMLVLGGLAGDAADAARRLGAALASGAAAERFGQMVAALGGPGDLMEAPERYLPDAPLSFDVVADTEIVEACAGHLAFDTRQLGMAVIELGGGRTRPQDGIDHAVGLTAIAGRDWDGASPLCRIHARDEGSGRKAERRILAAARPGKGEPPAVLERIG
jgi:thymidine phosphorylase